MKRELISPELNWYKANLHCHTTLSDGKMTPEEVKRIYREKGYSVLAITDHDLFLAHPELADDTFLPLYGYEIEVNEPGTNGSWINRKCCHLCLVALEESIRRPVCLHRNRYNGVGNSAANEWRMALGDMPDYVRVYSAEGINEIIRTGKEAGFFVTYNHPTWSMETFGEYGGYEGMDAMEIMNGNCIAGGYGEYNDHAYDDLLRQGKRILCVANDDNHDEDPLGSVYNDSFRAFTMIGAEELTYPAVARALREKNAYASSGPLFEHLAAEDGTIRVRCSDVKKILFSTGARYCERVFAEEGETVREAVFSFRPEFDYFRVTLEDGKGGRAYSRAYFADEIYG